MTVTQLTPRLLQLAALILNPSSLPKPLVLADNEHFSGELLQTVCSQTPFDLLVPMRKNQSLMASMKSIPPEDFQRHWAGWATTHRSFQFRDFPESSYHQLIQRTGENPSDFQYNAFLATRYENDVLDLSIHYPQRWHVEEFFNAYQDLGWKRAGTMNLNIRLGQMSMALVAQAVSDQLRKRLGDPFASWDARHFASAIFRGIDGDVRVSDSKIIVTLYNAPHSELLKKHYENLPKILEHENIDPRVPWLFDYKLDFHFR